MIYLDNGATTKVSSNVFEIIRKTMLEDYGNPSSLHNAGFNAEKYLKDSRETISSILKCEPSEIYFTSGGTESNNTCLKGAALAYMRAGKHIITTRVEHASVYNPLLFLEERGFELSFCEVDRYGRVDIDNLVSLVRDDTTIVSVMYVNNEIGAVNDIAEISRRIKEKNPKVLLHVDAVQAFGKFPIFPAREGIDMLSVSGHKFHGPKGSGFMYIRKGVKVKALVHGGGQEKDMRSGTQNVPAIAGIGVAATDMYDHLKENRAHMFILKQMMIDGVADIEGTFVHGLPEDVYTTAPHIVSIGFAGVRSEVLLHALEDKGIMVSSGSACSSNHPAISGTLKAVGTDKKYLDSTIRFSFSRETTEEEIRTTLDALHELIPVLRRYSRK